MRPKPTLKEEKKLWKNGYRYVVGIDEVGRGAFAGPVVAAAVVFSRNFRPPDDINDSKLVKPRRREFLAQVIKKEARCFSIAEIATVKINKYGIGKATQMCFRKAVRLLPIKPDYVLIDAFYRNASSAYIKHMNRKNQKPIKKGDQKSISIAAASIIAKVYRDSLMKRLHKKYPQYRLAKNKGYGTKEHREAIKKYGLSRIHRKSFNLEGKQAESST
ncbi:MAG: ribonuclease HII [Candidatus Levybacteria bacterium]|nr:ribonuclease HII [Candidatus Levybacteria bacterium]